MTTGDGLSALWKKEDWWAVWLGLGIIGCAIGLALLLGLVVGNVRTPPTWIEASLHRAEGGAPCLWS